MVKSIKRQEVWNGNILSEAKRNLYLKFTATQYTSMHAVFCGEKLDEWVKQKKKININYSGTSLLHVKWAMLHRNCSPITNFTMEKIIDKQCMIVLYEIITLTKAWCLIHSKEIATQRSLCAAIYLERIKDLSLIRSPYSICFKRKHNPLGFSCELCWLSSLQWTRTNYHMVD